MNILIAKLLVPVIMLALAPIPTAIAEPSEGAAGQEAVTASASVIATAASPKVITESYVAVITAYNSEVGQTDSDPFIAANGKTVFNGLMACSRAIPFGAKVTLSKTGKTYTCGDRKAQKYDDATNPNLPLPEFDIWMEHKSDARAWGRRTMEVTVTYAVR